MSKFALTPETLAAMAEVTRLKREREKSTASSADKGSNRQK
jgi:hypothetical protein